MYVFGFMTKDSRRHTLIDASILITDESYTKQAAPSTATAQKGLRSSWFCQLQWVGKLPKDSRNTYIIIYVNKGGNQTTMELPYSKLQGSFCQGSAKQTYSNHYDKTSKEPVWLLGWIWNSWHCLMPHLLTLPKHLTHNEHDWTSDDLGKARLSCKVSHIALPSSMWTYSVCSNMIATYHQIPPYWMEWKRKVSLPSLWCWDRKQKT